MARPTFEDVMQAWTADYNSALENMGDLFSQELKLATKILQLLSEGKPVSAVQAADQSGLSLEQVQAVLDHFAARGGEVDQDGNLVGAALTLNPTSHHLTIGDRQLYAWCALDTFFLSGMIGKTAEVTSTDPVTGETIRLTITPESVANYTPSSTVLSITVPGLSCRTDESCGPETGPESEACSQMHFFTSRQSAEVWLRERPGIAILTVDEAWRLAKANWLDRGKRLQATGNNAVHCAC